MTSVPLSRRAGGLDLARGLALLGIALANTVGWLYGQQRTALVKQADTTALDRSTSLLALLVDNGFPLFALLFGYGIGILYRASQRRGELPPIPGRQARRHLVCWCSACSTASSCSPETSWPPTPSSGCCARGWPPATGRR